MTPSADAPLPSLHRVKSGIPGLDEVTDGGFLRSGVYIVQGVPGAGKTILANQICHAHAAGGGRVVYVTLLAESHARLMQHMQEFAFFDTAALPDKVTYVSAFNALRTQGLPGVVNLLRSEMRSHAAGILVLDGLVMAASAAASDEALKLFISDLQAHSTLTGCTTLLLTSDDADRPVSAEQTMVDGILLLRERHFGPRRERHLEVVKFRGSRTLRGAHTFQIGPKGIEVFPRLEAARQQPVGDAVQFQGISSGVPGIDRMFEIGGYGRGGITVLTGSSGTGKTTLALHFAAQSTPAERGLYFSFYESPQFLQEIARVHGIDPHGRLASDAVEFVWNPFGETVLDELAARLLQRVAASGAKRVVIDGLGGFLAAPAYASRGEPFVAALMNELRRLGATALAILEQPQPGYLQPVNTPALSSIGDSILNLSMEHTGAVRRFLWIGKSRISRVDLRVRQLVLGAAGLAVIDGQEAPVGG